MWCSGLKICHWLCGGVGSVPSLIQWVKDPPLLQLWHGLKLRLRFDSWELPYAVGVEKKKEKKKRELLYAMGVAKKRKREKICSRTLYSSS